MRCCANGRCARARVWLSLLDILTASTKPSFINTASTPLQTTVSYQCVLNRRLKSFTGTVREWKNLDLSAREASLVAANVTEVPALKDSVRPAPDVGLGVVRSERGGERARALTVLRETLEHLQLDRRQLAKIVLVPKNADNMDLLTVSAAHNHLQVRRLSSNHLISLVELI